MNAEKNIEQSELDIVLGKIKIGIILWQWQQELSERQQQSVDGMSDEVSRLTMALQYMRDIVRIHEEMKMTISFMKKLFNGDDMISVEFPVEKQIVYYQGILLTLTHQMKDKIFRLCDAISTKGKFKEREKVKIKYIAGRDGIKGIDGLIDELKTWEQEQKNPIGWALSRRTIHHHYRSKLSSDKNLQDVIAARQIQDSNKQDEGILSEYGVSEMIELEKTGLEKWRESVLSEADNMLKEMQGSLHNIANLLYSHFDFESINNNAQEIVDKHFDMLKSFDVINTCSYDNIHDDVKKIIEDFPLRPDINSQFGIRSLYIIGDVPRGDALQQVPSVDLVIVFDDDGIAIHADKVVKELKRQHCDLCTLNIKSISVADFSSESEKKLRFLCKKDGILLAGEDIIGDEKFPKIGLKLAFLLNSDVGVKVTGFREEIEHLKSSSPSQFAVDTIAADICKMIIEVMFSAVMTENAVYERNISNMRELINVQYPENQHLLDNLYQCATREAHYKLDSVEVMIQVFDKDGMAFSMMGQIEELNKKLKSRKVFR